MNRHQFLPLIRKHWTTYLPSKVKALKESGSLREAMQGAAASAEARVDDLRRQGYPDWAAEEVALKEFVYLPPEPGADEEDWEREESAELEAAYQKNPPIPKDDEEDDLPIR